MLHQDWVEAVPVPVWAFLAFLALQRLAEIAHALRNLRKLLSRGAQLMPRDGLLPIVLVQTALIAALPLETRYLDRDVDWMATPWILAWLGANGLRYWAVATLGPFWTIRVARLPQAPLVATGPYRYLRHPNYLAVAIETFAIPLIFGCLLSAILLGGANLVALGHRIRKEERFLGLAPDEPKTPPPLSPAPPKTG